MDRRNWKEKVASVIAKTAMGKAEKTVGKSIPIAVYEVEVPEELKLKRPNEEA